MVVFNEPQFQVMMFFCKYCVLVLVWYYGWEVLCLYGMCKIWDVL
jgi:hypothetical protein